MADKSEQTFELPKQSNLVAGVFNVALNTDALTREKVMKIPLSEIDPFPNHPFLVKNDEAMQNTQRQIIRGKP